MRPRASVGAKGRELKVQNLFSVEGAVVLVTGGSRGIGAMIAEGFLRNGAAKVYITARKAAECEAAAERLGAFGACVAIPADLSTTEGIEAVAARIEAAGGGLAVLVNNAGAVWAEPFESFWRRRLGQDHEHQRQGAVLPDPAPAHAAERPRQRRGARARDYRRLDRRAHCPPLETYPYSASKAAVHHLTRTLAARLAKDNILVNCIAPGPFEQDDGRNAGRAGRSDQGG